MEIKLAKHPLVDGLFFLIFEHVEVYFNYVGYDSADQRLIFERDDEVVTCKMFVACDEQLELWEQALEKMSIELEHYSD